MKKLNFINVKIFYKIYSKKNENNFILYKYQNNFEIFYLNFYSYVNIKFKKFLKNKFFDNKSLQSDFINTFIRGGNKLKLLKYLNTAINIFYYSFYFNNSFLKNKFKNYDTFLNFAKLSEIFFDFDFILINLIQMNESILDLKVLKKPKKKKSKKSNIKYIYKVSFLKKNKRIISIFKKMHLKSNSFNYYRYYERFLTTLYYAFLEQKNSFLYKHKILVYKLFLKKK